MVTYVYLEPFISRLTEESVLLHRVKLSKRSGCEGALQFKRVDGSLDFTVQFIIRRRRIPVFFIEKTFRLLKELSARGSGVDDQMRQRFREFASGTVNYYSIPSINLQVSFLHLQMCCGILKLTPWGFQKNSLHSAGLPLPGDRDFNPGAAGVRLGEHEAASRSADSKGCKLTRAATPPSVGMLSLLFVLYFLEYGAQAMPMLIWGRATTPDTSAETRTVTHRTTFSIVWSCVSTVVICTWVSVHPNVPPRSQKGALLQRLKMMVWTIIAPELVLAWAVRQWFGARLVTKRYKHHGWTMSHGHFLVMGGFVLVSDNVKKPKRPSGTISWKKRDDAEEPRKAKELRQLYEQGKQHYEKEKRGYEQGKTRYDEEKEFFEKEKRRYEQGQYGEDERRESEGERQTFEDNRRRYEESRRRYEEIRRRYDTSRRRYEEDRRRCRGSIRYLSLKEEQRLVERHGGEPLQEEVRRFLQAVQQSRQEGQRLEELLQEEGEVFQQEGRLYEDERDEYEAERRYYEEEILRSREKQETDDDQEERPYGERWEDDEKGEQREPDEGRRRYEEERRQYEEQRLSDEEKVQHYNRRLRKYNATCRFQRLGTLSYEHFCDLVRHSRVNFPAIADQDIKDKSKGDFLSKTLAILQTTWFLVQCGARGVQGLALTELELVTLALASLNAVTFVFWWHKPLGVQEPVKIYLKTPEEGPLPQTEDDQGVQVVTVRHVVAEIHDSYGWTKLGIFERLLQGPTPGLYSALNAITIIVYFFFALIVSWSFGVFLGLFAIATALLLSVLTTHPPTRDETSHSEKHLTHINYTLRKIRYLIFSTFSNILTNTLSSAVYQWAIPILFVLLVLVLPLFVVLFMITFLVNAVFGIVTTDTIRPGAEHVPAFYAPKTKSDRYSRMLVFGSFGVFFGGLHCIGWYFVYPTYIEQTLWRVTSLAITVIPFVVALIDFFLFNINENSTHRSIQMILEATMTTLLFIYVPSRLSLIAQALALLRNQPPDAFVALNWTQYLPHVLLS